MGFESLEAWSQWCFVGFASAPAAEMADFGQEQVQSLLGIVGAEKVVGSVSPLDPRHLINQKGVTAWQVIFTVARFKDLEGLGAVSQGRAMLLLPGTFLRPAFTSHVNWPPELLGRYRLEPRGLHPFVVPFVVHESAPNPRQLERSLGSPDGALEIWSVVEFRESHPEALLAEIQRLAQHVDQQRAPSPAPGGDA
jgi:hypothetical protein